MNLGKMDFNWKTKKTRSTNIKKKDKFDNKQETKTKKTHFFSFFFSSKTVSTQQEVEFKKIEKF